MAALKDSAARRRSAGQAMAEFAIVLPILLIILLAVFDVGRLVFAYNDITNAARNGARVAIVDQTANKARDTAIQGAGLGLKNSQVQVTYLTDDLSGTCPSPYELGCVAKVAVSYDWQADHPADRQHPRPDHRHDRHHAAHRADLPVISVNHTADHPQTPGAHRPMTRTRRTHEAGQALVIMAIAIVAVIAGVGLIIDGGNAWAQQRISQNGNDAVRRGRRRGARELPVQCRRPGERLGRRGRRGGPRRRRSQRDRRRDRLLHRHLRDAVAPRRHQGRRPRGRPSSSRPSQRRRPPSSCSRRRGRTASGTPCTATRSAGSRGRCRTSAPFPSNASPS